MVFTFWLVFAFQWRSPKPLEGFFPLIFQVFCEVHMSPHVILNTASNASQSFFLISTHSAPDEIISLHCYVYTKFILSKNNTTKFASCNKMLSAILIHSFVTAVPSFAFHFNENNWNSPLKCEKDYVRIFEKWKWTKLKWISQPMRQRNAWNETMSEEKKCTRRTADGAYCSRKVLRI